MKLGLEVGLSPGHIVLDGDPAPSPPKGTAPNFRSMSVAAEWIKMPLDTEVGLGPGDFVLDGDPAPPKKGAQLPPPRNFWPMSIVAKRSPTSATAELLLMHGIVLLFTSFTH